MRVAVVGGGVIGLSCAFFLAREGAEVVLFESDRCGYAASRGNAGWVAAGVTAPLPAPGVVRQALPWLLHADSPLLIRPRLQPSLWRWCLEFARSSSSARYAAGAAALLRLHADSDRCFDALTAGGVAYERYDTGLLFVAHDGRDLAHYAEELERLRGLGAQLDVRVLDRAAAHALEPALAAGVAGGVLAPSDWYVRPETLTRGLAERLVELGVELREGAAVRSLRRGPAGDGWTLDAAGGAEAVDAVVLAAGVDTPALLRPLGVRLRMEGAKGYSITAAGSGRAPEHALYFVESKVGCSPFDGAVRLAGTLELGSRDLLLNDARVAAIARSAEAYLDDWRPERPELVWAGFRPMPADGLPIVGEVPGLPGLHVATGHGMLGVTLAPATGAAVAELLTGGAPVDRLAPFAVGRVT